MMFTRRVAIDAHQTGNYVYVYIYTNDIACSNGLTDGR